MKLTWEDIYNITRIVEENCTEEWEKKRLLPICYELREEALHNYDNFEIKGIK